MPERQSSPGEVTARPETDVTENGNGRGPEDQGRAAVSGSETGGAGTDGFPTAAEQVAEQVADQVAAGPGAAEPAPAEPADGAPTGDEVVLDGSTAVEIARRGPAAPADDATPSEAATAPEDPAGDPPADSGDSADTPKADTPKADTPKADTPKADMPKADVLKADAAPGQAASAAAPADAPAEGEPAAAAPRLRPRPRPAPVSDEEAPTVRTAAGAPAAATSAAAAAATNGRVTTGVSTEDARPEAGAAGGEAPTTAVRVAAGDAAGAVAGAAASGAPAGSDSRPSPGGPGSWFSAVDAEATQMIPRTAEPAGAAEPPAADPPTERIPLAASGGVPPTDGAGPDEPVADGRPPRRRRLLVAAGVLALLGLLYVGDVVLSSGSVPRGVTVAGVEVGGLGIDEAEQRLRTEIEPRTAQPVAVTVGEAMSEIDPTTAGLTVDWTGTLDQAGSQPLNPITRITSFFTEREIGVVTATDPQALDAALAELAPIVDKAATEGSVRFEGSTPVPVDPVPGQQLDVSAAADVLRQDWATGRSVALPLTELPPTTTPEDVAAAIEEVARPAVSAPVAVAGEGGIQGTITPQVIASALTFRADGGELVPEINQNAVTEALTPQLAASERPGRDASLDFASGAPVVVPSQDGRGVDYEATLRGLLDVLTGSGPRQITAVYADQPAELTTDELNALGISGVIGEFTTRGFAADSGRNIKRAADQINGMVVQPGETFSLNGATAPRNAANGYVEAGIISDGHPSRGVGGGVSQVATTLYNASYFAGMADVAHKEHSFYISRYPAGREATVFEGSIDLKFRNDNPTGVLIQTVWTPESLTVRLYGTKRYEVTSTPGPRTNPTNPNTVTIPAGEPCSPSQGAPGFTVTDTRTIREISTGEVRNETRTVRYNPSPIVVCGG
jgi:vancomycin resistance protein YoaR